jgi:hypothetical protein
VRVTAPSAINPEVDGIQHCLSDGRIDDTVSTPEDPNFATLTDAARAALNEDLFWWVENGPTRQTSRRTRRRDVRGCSAIGIPNHRLRQRSTALRRDRPNPSGLTARFPRPACPRTRGDSCPTNARGRCIYQSHAVRGRHPWQPVWGDTDRLASSTLLPTRHLDPLNMCDQNAGLVEPLRLVSRARWGHRQGNVGTEAKHSRRLQSRPWRTATSAIRIARG